MRAIRLHASSSLNGLAVEQIDLPVPAGAGDALVHVPALQLLVVAFWRKSDADAVPGPRSNKVSRFRVDRVGPGTRERLGAHGRLRIANPRYLRDLREPPSRTSK
jgi:hypothetical protein